ncbi:MAG: PPC domain-containing protein [Caldilinea sp.]|nr:PPC domain-containing protein [Caldilinea sp.]
MNVSHIRPLTGRPGLLQVLLVLLMLLWPATALHAAAPAQDGPQPLLLGEFGRASLDEGQSVSYTLATPVDGTYTVVYTGDGDPAAFGLVIAGADGTELYNDVMQVETLIDLTAGEYLLTFTAQAKADLAFLVGIEAGSMSEDSGEPGELFNGGVFVTSNVGNPLYATLTIEPSAYPQQVALLVQGGEGDVYSAEVFSEDFDYWSTYTDDSEVVQFPTTGGVYEVTVSPVEGGSELQVSVFLSGPAPVLEMGAETSGELTEAGDSDTYQFEVTAAGASVTVQAGADDGADLTVAAGTQPDAETWYEYSFGDEPASLQFVAPQAGTYYLKITTDTDSGATYTVLAEQGETASTLPVNEPVAGFVAEAGQVGYLLEMTEPDQFVVVVLAGPEDQDLDLTLARYEDGEQTASDSSYASGSREVVALFSADPGVFIVTVDGSYAADSDFTILATTGALTELMGMEGAAPAADEPAADEPAADEPAADEPGTDTGLIEQWATSAEASSQYGDEDWSAQQATGEPDTLDGGDTPTAWAAAFADSEAESLVLAFDVPVIPAGIEIYESYNPGAIAKIEVLDPNTDEWVVVWEGTAETAGEDMAVFSPALTAIDFATSQVRLTIDEPAIVGWNEIDAVKLIGTVE